MGSYGSKMAPLTREICPPSSPRASLLLYPSLVTPPHTVPPDSLFALFALCPKIAHHKGFLVLSWNHMGRMAHNRLKPLV